MLRGAVFAVLALAAGQAAIAPSVLAQTPSKPKAGPGDASGGPGGAIGRQEGLKGCKAVLGGRFGRHTACPGEQGMASGLPVGENTRGRRTSPLARIATGPLPRRGV